MLADKQEDRSRCIAVGADKTHNARGFVAAARAFNVTRTTQNEKGRSNIDGRMTTHPGLRQQPDLPLAGREGVQPGKPSIALQPMVIIRQAVEKCPKRG
jgi:hypothetical protein